jgi:hypothetical protein
LRRAVAALLLLALPAGCKTRLWGLPDDGEPVPDGEFAVDAAFAPLDLIDNCGVVTIQTTEVVRADLLLVQDKSRSMTQGVNGERNPAPGQSKWELIRAALTQVVNGTSSVNWGLMLFGSDNRCDAPTVPDVPVGAGSAPAITNTLAATTPNASTPTRETLKNALAYFQGLGDGHPHYLLLATDGEPGCAGGGMGPGGGSDGPATEQAVANAAAAGIHTFVVGIGSNMGDDQVLAQMAVNGLEPDTSSGTPSFYPVSSTQDLVDVLEKAALRITTCSYPLASLPPNPDAVTIESAVGIIPRDPTHMDGWDYGSDGKSVDFFGPACAQLQSGVVMSVQAIFACPG